MCQHQIPPHDIKSNFRFFEDEAHRTNKKHQRTMYPEGEIHPRKTWTIE